MRAKKIIGETLVAFKQGAKLNPNGPIPSVQSLERWAFKGLKSKCDASGNPITLEYCYVGGRLYTSVEAFERWMKKINQI